ncbi:hypothetical protein Metin_1398 [Methanocaldococcus infernus ME]|uniref:Lipoprotein n=1 Tax=Methanocaldococcus infernus (strain DSM 11812 / JCM 15783 / ME) TaxID=573063 RepID=D5VTZ5_METIM|nr:hypothetical protein [Methanocaldococcus infernus]ADG14048.1 hypothetical protein Metin_1398 [Methanocaldococcus infernus ME]
MRKFLLIFLAFFIILSGCTTTKEEKVSLNLYPLDKIESLKCNIILEMGGKNISGVCEFDDNRYYFYKDNVTLTYFYNNTFIKKGENSSIKIIYINFKHDLDKINAIKNLLLPLYDNETFKTEKVERKDNYIYVLRVRKYSNVSIGYYIKDGLPEIIDLGGGNKIYIKYIEINKEIKPKIYDINASTLVVYANVSNISKIKKYLAFKPILFNVSIESLVYANRENKSMLKIAGKFKNKTVVISEEYPYNGSIYLPLYVNVSYDNVEAYYNPLGGYLLTLINNTFIKIYADNETAIELLKTKIG